LPPALVGVLTCSVPAAWTVVGVEVAAWVSVALTAAWVVEVVA
jgi:hypothetical protein